MEHCPIVGNTLYRYTEYRTNEKYGSDVCSVRGSTLRELPALIFSNWVHFKQIYL